MQTSKYANDMMENADVSRNKSKKKLRFFSKSKKRNTTPTDYPYTDQHQQCYCEDCMKTVHQNNYMLSNQQMAQYYYPREDQISKTQSLSTEHRLRDESSYMSEQIDHIYPPPQQFPCQCTNCCKKRGTNLTTELLPLDTQIPLQMMSADSALLCNIL